MTQLSTERDSLKKADESRKSQMESEAKAGKLQKELLAIRHGPDGQLHSRGPGTSSAATDTTGTKITLQLNKAMADTQGNQSDSQS